jgi:putative pyruvate formate lyase activating enzyme
MASETIDFFRSHLEACELCPRRCRVNRLAGETGLCRAGATVKVASHCVHTGEEPPISGSRGSGTIFFSHCSMACVYCQNYPISQMGYGNEVGKDELAGMMLDLEARGAHNINLVTPTHFLPGIVEAVIAARTKGLGVPIVSNTSGYETPEVVAMLGKTVQVYLADMRYANGEAARKYSGAADYPERNRVAVRAMLDAVGHLRCRGGVAESGLIVRHLVLPSMVSQTRGILEFVSRELSSQTAVSLMSQYFPANKANLYPEINRKISSDEYQTAVSLLEEFGLGQGWTQEPGPSDSPVA